MFFFGYCEASNISVNVCIALIQKYTDRQTCENIKRLANAKYNFCLTARVIIDELHQKSFSLSLSRSLSPSLPLLDQSLLILNYYSMGIPYNIGKPI